MVENSFFLRFLRSVDVNEGPANWNANSIQQSLQQDEAKLVFLSFELNYLTPTIEPYIKLKLIKSCI